MYINHIHCSTFNTKNDVTSTLCGLTHIQYKKRCHKYILWTYTHSIQKTMSQVHSLDLHTFNTKKRCHKYILWTYTHSIQKTMSQVHSVDLHTFNTKNDVTSTFCGLTHIQYKKRCHKYTLWTYSQLIHKRCQNYTL